MQTTTSRHTLPCEHPASLPALVDPLRLEQVVTNLLDNAIKFSPAGGQIDVELDAAVLRRVRSPGRADHGIGIPPERRQHIFDRFYQAHDGDHACRAWASACTSAARSSTCTAARSRPEFPLDGGGTRFTVDLPTGYHRRPRGAGRERASVTRAARILVVEDDEASGTWSTSCCGPQATRSLTATNGAAALQVVGGVRNPTYPARHADHGHGRLGDRASGIARLPGARAYRGHDRRAGCRPMGCGDPRKRLPGQAVRGRRASSPLSATIPATSNTRCTPWRPRLVLQYCLTEIVRDVLLRTYGLRCG